MKYFISEMLWKRRLNLTKISANTELKAFIDRFRANYHSVNLHRIGDALDGGYLLPDVMDQIDYCFSPGVSDCSSFEYQLANDYQIPSFLADASVKGPAKDSEYFSFIPTFIGSKTSESYITLSDWVSSSLPQPSNKLLLQMDIEGAEYEVLAYEDSAFLSQFSVMVIEFHTLQKLFESTFCSIVSALFEKIFKDFIICHAHPNNCCGIAAIEDVSVPRVLEVTFLRRDLLASVESSSSIILPHPDDTKNLKDLPDITLPDIWWKK